MKRKFIYVLMAFFMLFATAFVAQVEADEADIAGKIVFHYQKWDQDYTSAGLWCWNTGTGGSQAPVTSDVTDSFGAVYEVEIASDANGDGKGIGIIACRKDITLDSRWNYRETPEGENFVIDPTPILSGETTEMHVYYFQGGYQTFYVTDPTKVNIFVAYFDPTNSYEANLGIYSWGSWANEELQSVAWGTPAKLFSDGFKSPSDVKGKIALLQIDQASIKDAGFLVYAGDDATKKTPDNASNAITDFATLQNGDVKMLYITNSVPYYGETATASFADAAFKFDFMDYAPADVSGTYAVDPHTIFVKFTQDIVTKVKVGEEEVTKFRTVLKPKLKEGSVPFVQTDKTFDQFTALPALDANSIGRVVLHYQNWSGDYTGHGTWSWNRGGSYTGGTAMLGVDSFGAVVDLPIAADASDSIGFIAIKGNATNSGDWPGDENKDSGDLTVDVTAIKDGTVEEIHVYYFAGGSTVFVADPNQANVLVVYYDLTGNYEETLGFHAWGNWSNEGVATAAWGTPLAYFQDGFVSPRGVKGKVALLQTPDASQNPGFLIYAGPDDSKKTPENASNSLADFTTTAVGDVRVLYVALESAYDGVSKKADFATAAFSGEIEWVEEQEEYKEMVDVLDFIDFIPLFTVLQGETAQEIEKINFNQTADKCKEFVIVMKNALDNTLDYTLKYDNGLTGDDQRTGETELALDKAAPVIELISEDADLVIKQGAKFDLFPIYRVTDDRDSNLVNRVYVKEGHGTLNTGVAGTYPITLVVEDTWGNVGELTFNFTVEAVSSGCKNNNASIALFSLFGLALIFFRRRRLA